MPGLSGVDALAEIRRRTGDRGAPALLMSGVSAPEQISRALAAGVTDFIAKPFDREVLWQKVRDLIDGYLRRREADAQRAEIEALHARRDLEAAAASAVLGQMLSRGEFDPDQTQRLVVPADTFSGDFVFGATTPEGAYRWMVGDVSGHTLSSALVTIPISMIFYATASRAVPLDETIATFERELATLLPMTMFCAAVLCELDRARGRLQVWNGGLPEVLIRRARAQALVGIEARDPPLAVARGTSWPRDITAVDVSPGDRIVALSDGLVESRGPDGAMLGIEAAAEVVRTAPPAEIFAQLVACWRAHAARGREDDVALVEVTV
jgi:serine phosphatase RsbU (regulator of sigma subunit)